MQRRGVPLGALAVVGVIEGRSARARIRSRPHQQADPLQLALLAELAQRHVGLFLQLFCEVRPVTSAVQIGSQSGLSSQLAKGMRERVASNRVGASFEKSGHDRSVARQKHVQEGNRTDLGPMRDCQFDERWPVQHQRQLQGVVLDLLVLFVSQKEFDEAVKPRRDGDAQGRLSDFARNGQGPAGTYPGFDFVEPAGFTEPDQLFGLGR